ncbi:MAG: (d)CMP kinase [Candidatus Nanopelagicales bacterium]
MPESVIVAVDGPAGSGKSSVCRGSASALGLRYLDTGAMYRAMTCAVLDAGIDPSDTGAVAAYATTPVITSGTDPKNPTIEVNGIDVSEPIRSESVTSAVSPVSAVPEVRARLVALQREHVIQARQARVGIVVEGRDIGTVVLPDADVKVYLTADPAVRAARRAAETGTDALAATEAALKARDDYDSSRTTSPLIQADDAYVVDTTEMTLQQVIDHVCDLVNERRENDV